MRLCEKKFAQFVRQTATWLATHALRLTSPPGLTVDRSQNFIQLPCRGTIRKLECRFNSHFIRLLREPTAVKIEFCHLTRDVVREYLAVFQPNSRRPHYNVPFAGGKRTGDENTRRSVGRISWAITQRQLIHPAQLWCLLRVRAANWANISPDCTMGALLLFFSFFLMKNILFSIGRAVTRKTLWRPTEKKSKRRSCSIVKETRRPTTL